MTNHPHFSRVASILALAMVFTSVTASPASADPGRQEDDRGKLARVIVDFGDRSAKVGGPNGGLTPMSSGCTTTYHMIMGTNRWGEWLWRVEQNTYWCWNGSTVTYAARSTPVYTYGVGWRSGGVMSSSETAVGTYEYRAYVQTLFYRCFPSPWGEVCTDHTYPWIRSILRGDGTNGGSAGT